MCCNDAIASETGFSEAQLNRLALVYVAASVRRGNWLIPVFHYVQAADSLQRLLTELER